MSKQDEPVNIFDALTLCKTGRKVRPTVWAESWPGHWVESKPFGDGVIFVECSARDEVPHRLSLQFEVELLGPWEVLP